uniref:RHS repeat domain-containing protein n=2 Tax=uncultured Aquimarina sp. TaxID=575652 RepID=UPI00261CBFE2
IWKTANDNVKRSYSYQYDDLNRITRANSLKGSTLMSGDAYSIWGIAYDKNGNIGRITRNGRPGGGSIKTIDELYYTYSNNKLLKVREAITSSYRNEGFKDGTNTNDDFVYDQNGNMTVDRNKGISSISYNHLNLPNTVAISNSEGTGNISYIYDATGVKQKKVVSGGSSLTTEYAGNHVYENGQLTFFNHPEGYIEPSGTGEYDYVYQYKDHLDNIRLSYSDKDKDGHIDILINNADVDGDGDNAREILQEKNYYPFGLQHKGYNELVISEHKYGFGGKEEQDELGLGWIDVTARNYDPALGRWMNLDPLAEMMRKHSPYNYAFDNPLVFVDPDGMAPFTVIGADAKAQENIKNQLPKESQKFVKFDENGELDADLISEGAKANPKSGNLQRIAHLANSEDTYVFSTSDNFEAFDKDTGKIEKTNFQNGDSAGSLGITLPTDDTEITANVSEVSTNENTQVIVANTISDEKQAKTTSHETVHAYLFDVAKNHGGTETPWHQIEPGGMDEETGAVILLYTSPKQMKPAEKEAIKNYRANNK